MKRYFIGGGGVILSLLASCTFTPYTTNFECPMEKGAPCTRMSKINRMVDRGELGIEGDDAPHGSICKGSCSTQSLSRETPITYFYKKEEPSLQQQLIEESAMPVEEIKDTNPSEDIKEETEEEGPSIRDTEEVHEL